MDHEAMAVQIRQLPFIRMLSTDMLVTEVEMVMVVVVVCWEGYLETVERDLTRARIETHTTQRGTKRCT
jgi:hypothetical protein